MFKRRIPVLLAWLVAFALGGLIASAAPLSEGRTPDTLAADFLAATPFIGPVPLNVTFNNLSTGGATSYRWLWGDGSPDTITHDTDPVSHDFTSSGVYSVTLVASAPGETTAAKVRPNYVFADALPGDTYFSDISAQTGTGVTHQISPRNALYLGTGVAWGDVNNDDNLDLFVSNNGGANWLFINSGPPNYTFTEQAAARGVDDPTGVSGGAVLVDYDNDGSQDLIVLNWDPDGPNGTRPRTRLYHNSGPPTYTFTDVAAATRLAADGWRRGISAAWGDYDQDGLLDLYIVNHTNLNCQCRPTNYGSEDLLYHQNPDHSFTNVSSLLLPAVNLYGTGTSATWTDYDHDGWLDLYVVNDAFVADNFLRRNVLWHNDHTTSCGRSWCFTDTSFRTNAVLRNGTIYGLGLSVADLDNRDTPDLFYSNIGPSKLMFNNVVTEKFSEQSQYAGVGRSSFGEGLAVGFGAYGFDFDNDEWQDVFVTNGVIDLAHGEQALQPDSLFRTWAGLARMPALVRSRPRAAWMTPVMVTRQPGAIMITMAGSICT